MDISDRQQLQADLNNLCDWSRKWKLQFKALSKCALIRFGTGDSSSAFPYYIYDDEVEAKYTHKDLGVV